MKKAWVLSAASAAACFLFTSPEASAATIRVQQGDTLYSLARQHKMSVSSLMAQNKLSGTTIRVGQTLTVSAPAPSLPARHTVKKGEYVYQIARLYKISPKDLIAWNRLTTSSLKIGQVLVLSAPSAQTTPAPPPTPSPAAPVPASSVVSYTVQKGDTLTRIAAELDTSVSALMSLNRLSGPLIRIGQTLSAPKPDPIFQMPVKGRLSSEFRTDHRPDHHGIDIAEAGTVSIQAAASGVVSRSYFSSTYGHVVFLVHQIGGQTYETVYAHMRDRAVSEGGVVSAGQHLGYMGNTGRSYGQHLHFEVHKGRWNLSKSNAVNPLYYLP